MIEVDKLVDAYISIRNERDNIAREHELKDRELVAQLEKLEVVMLERCNEIQADSIKTKKGTIIKNLKENYVCGDWDNFKQYILENQALELLQQRISTLRQFKISVRKPSNK